MTLVTVLLFAAATLRITVPYALAAMGSSLSERGGSDQEGDHDALGVLHPGREVYEDFSASLLLRSVSGVSVRRQACTP